MYVIVYNSIAQSRSLEVRLPVASGLFLVERIDKHPIQARYVHSIPSDPSFGSRLDDPIYVLVFGTGKLPPLGATAFRVVKEPDPVKSTSGDYARLEARMPAANAVRRRRLRHGKKETVEVSNDGLSAEFDSSSGALVRISARGVSMEINQTFGYYESFDASVDSSDENDQSSGAYIFRPRSPLRPLTVKSSGGRFIRTSNGIEVRTTYEEPWIQQVCRINEDDSFIEVEYIVGPVPIVDGKGKEVVSLYGSTIQNDGVFYTDSNGRDFQQRIRNFRSSWDLEVFEPIAGNYYPVNAAAYIEDTEASFAVLVDRSQGGSSLQDGSVEIMIQRRTIADDHRGVDEPLNETTGGMSPYPPFGTNERIGDGVVIRGKHRIMVGNGWMGASLARLEMDGMFAEPLVFVGSGPLSDPIAFLNATISGLNFELPPNVMLITFMRMPDCTFLLRLGHQFAQGEDERLSDTVNVDISHLFKGYDVLSAVETTLTGNEDWIDRLARHSDWAASHHSNANSQLTITLAPMEVKTFLINARLSSLANGS
jgi:Glycosyl hydrolases family 38 C-terminal domain/Glycosyl hydrolases family 38 C-terminal beta sandwich domain